MDATVEPSIRSTRIIHAGHKHALLDCKVLGAYEATSFAASVMQLRAVAAALSVEINGGESLAIVAIGRSKA